MTKIDTNTPIEKQAAVSVKTACKYLGEISRSKFYEIIGELETRKIGARRVVFVQSMNEYLANKPRA